MEAVLKARVENGRLLLNEPTTLPNGTIVSLRQTQEEATPVLSWREICARHPDEWVILVELLFAEVGEQQTTKDICGGVVFAHAPQRRELVAAHKDALIGRTCAILFTGKLKGLR